MKIAAYYPWIYLRGGAERILLELIRRSRHDWTLITNRYDPKNTFEGFRDLEVVELPRVSVKRTPWHVAQAGMTLLTQRISLDEYDALMVCMESIGNLVALRAHQLPAFCLCLTPLRVAFDPETRERFLRSNPSLMARLGVRAFSFVDRLGWRRYAKIFSISEEVATRLLEAKLAPESRIEILYPGVDLEEFQPGGPIEPYFLLPGRIMWTKNIELGIEAFGNLKKRVDAAKRFRLVIAGMVDEKSQSYLKKLRERAADIPDVEFIVDPTGESYRRLHRQAYAVLFTAFNEDWGLVPIEGMAAGRPVISVARGGPLESILHGETGYLCPPEPDAFSGAMEELVMDPESAEDMGRAGRQRAALFSWSNFASRIDEYVDSLTRESKQSAESVLSPGEVGR
jgi:glycosyltransferase involved in cell wall biosynthesis